MSCEVLKSQIDDSVNFVFRDEYPGMLEARYVRRTEKYFACYLSSQFGCKQACRMCHLTATKQTSASDASIERFLTQADAVLSWYDHNCPKAKIVHYNFMARGEPLANESLLNNGAPLFEALGQRSLERGLFPRFLISSILPRTLLGRSLCEIFPIIHPEIYYSIYSLNEDFRKRWLPKAMPVANAMDMLREYQENTKKIIKLHWAFIEGQNDKEDDVRQLCEMVKSSGVRVDVAIVRYNPFDETYGRETDESVIRSHVDVIKQILPFSKIKMITRVGADVKASCGMFVK